MPQCRICFGDEGTFIKPCTCTGTSKYVHATCLKRWINASRDGCCRTCGATFELRESFFAACARRIKKTFMPTGFEYAEKFIDCVYSVPLAMCARAPGPIEHCPGLTILPLKKVKHAIYEFAFQSLRFHVHWMIFNEFHNNKIMSFVRRFVRSCVSITYMYYTMSVSLASSRVVWKLARMISRVSGHPQNALLDSCVTAHDMSPFNILQRSTPIFVPINRILARIISRVSGHPQNTLLDSCVIAHDKAPFNILQRSAPFFVPINRISYMVVHFPLYSILPLQIPLDLLLIEKLRNFR